MEDSIVGRHLEIEKLQRGNKLFFQKNVMFLLLLLLLDIIIMALSSRERETRRRRRLEDDLFLCGIITWCVCF